MPLAGTPASRPQQLLGERMLDFDARIAAVLSADVAAFAALERDSPPQAARAVAQLKDALTTLAAQHRGTMAAAFGSIFRATFAGAADAVACAVALQDTIDERNKGLPEGDQVDTRAGVALGTIAQREGVLSGQGVDQADALRQLGEAGDVFISGAVFEQARAAAAATFAAEGVRSVAGEDLSVYVLDPARAARQQEKRQWQSRWEQHQHAWGKHRERHYDRMRRRFERQAEPDTARRERTGRARSPAERAEYELKNIKRLYRNAIYGALTIVFLFFVNVLTAHGPLWFLWPALGIIAVLALQAARTLGPDSVVDGMQGTVRRWGGWFAERREWAARSDAELADRVRRPGDDERTIRLRVAALRRFQRRTTTFGVLIAVLFVVNLLSSPGHWWVLWPALALGFVLAIQAVQVYGVDAFLGPDWEERKRQELRARFERET